MTRHPRTPAFLVLTTAASIGILYVAAWGHVERIWKQTPGDRSVEALEKRLADEQKTGAVKADTWLAYAQALGDARQFARAATAYKEVLALEPHRRDAKFQCGLALAQSDQPDAFHDFLKDLLYAEPKLAVELFERPESKTYLSQERFSALAKEAKNQAMD
jgi:cytochrome c-type biogenesis protein CcmH/NrfG